MAVENEQSRHCPPEIAENIHKLRISCREIDLGKFDDQTDSEAHKKGCCIYEISPALC